MLAQSFRMARVSRQRSASFQALYSLRFPSHLAGVYWHSGERSFQHLVVTYAMNIDECTRNKGLEA